MAETYGIQELAERGGVSRRTVRYYVQQKLLPAAAGTGRGEHYTREHLERLIRIRELQEAGVPLAEIPARLDGRASRAAATPAPGRREAPAPATTWTRIRIAEDVEIHLRSDRRGPWLLDEAARAELERRIRELVARG